jgi:hypothetical protein
MALAGYCGDPLCAGCEERIKTLVRSMNYSSLTQHHDTAARRCSSYRGTRMHRCLLGVLCAQTDKVTQAKAAEVALLEVNGRNIWCIFPTGRFKPDGREAAAAAAAVSGGGSGIGGSSSAYSGAGVGQREAAGRAAAAAPKVRVCRRENTFSAARACAPLGCLSPSVGGVGGAIQTVAFTLVLGPPR